MKARACNVIDVLSDHTPSSREEDRIGNAIDDSGTLSECRIDVCQDVANYGKALKAVVQANEPIVAWIRLDLVHVHGQKARTSDDKARTTRGLTAKAQSWARRLVATAAAALAWVPQTAAALRQISLTAHIVCESGAWLLGI